MNGVPIVSNQVLGWAPLVWTLRVASTALIAGASTVVFLYLLRFLRPRHIVAIVGGDLPSVRSVGATAKVLGTELEANAVLDTTQDEQMDLVRAGIVELRRRVQFLEARTGGSHGEERIP
jgi:hypothetical protein